MMPWLDTKNDVQIEVISKPKTNYQTGVYFELDLSVTPAIMVEDEMVVGGGNGSQQEVEIHWSSFRDFGTKHPKILTLRMEKIMVKMLLFHSGNPA